MLLKISCYFRWKTSSYKISHFQGRKISFFPIRCRTFVILKLFILNFSEAKVIPWYGKYCDRKKIPIKSLMLNEDQKKIP